MEEPELCAYKGRLLSISQREKSLELESLRHFKQSGFCNEVGSPTTLTSKVNWHVQDVKECVDDRTGIEHLFILASCKASVKTGTWFRILRANWRGGCIVSHSQAQSTRDRPAPDLMPVQEFTCTEEIDTLMTCFCVLTYGPRVLLVCHNKLVLFHENVKGRQASHKQEFLICESESKKTLTTGQSPATACQNAKLINSRVLSVISEQDWSMCIIHSSSKSWQAISSIALEKKPNDDKFERNVLNTRHFMPQEYAPKVSTVTIQSCHKTMLSDQSCFYQNVCLVGLNDGYVMTFANGIMQTCVDVWSQIDVAHPACGIIEVVLFSDILVCHTDDKHCFAVGRTDGKVVHHCDSVLKFLVGDFLQCGGRQLLLLFDGWLPQQPEAAYLLTDLQGFVEDGRESSEEDHLSQKNLQDRSGNLQHVISALQEQNHTLVRRVAEEEQRLEAKQQFVSETWKRLQDLSLGGLNTVPHLTAPHLTVPHLTAPEVPLVSVLGENTPTKSHQHGTQLQTAESCLDVSVQTMWHRVVDSVCVVGVKLVNTSSRELRNCVAILTSTSTTVHSQHQLSAHTKVWQCFETSTATSTTTEFPSADSNPQKQQKLQHQLLARQADAIQPSESVDSNLPKRQKLEHQLHARQADVIQPSESVDSNLPKRQKLEHQLHARQADVIQPSESVAVTCVFPVSDLGLCREREFLVHLQFVVKTLADSVSDDKMPARSVGASCRRSQGDGASSSKDRTRASETDGVEGSVMDERGDRGIKQGVREERTKLAFCGTFVVRASEALQQNSHLTSLSVGDSGNNPGNLTDAKLEEDLLLLSAIQHPWACQVRFVLHEATELTRSLQRAGFIFTRCLGQYVASSSAPECLRSVRVQSQGFLSLPQRAARFLVFVRDLNQLLLVIRHLYSHLPDDASITLVTEQRDTEIQDLMQLMSAELREKKKQAKDIMYAQKAAQKTKTDTAHQENTDAPGETSTKDGLESKPERVKLEAEEFAERQRLYRESQGSHVKSEHVGKYLAVIEDSETLTDVAMAKLNL